MSGERETRLGRVSPERGRPDDPEKRRYAPHVSRGLIWAAVLIVGACAYQPVPFSGVDCGTTIEGLDDAYDSRARDCVWSAYSRGAAVQWHLTSTTIEGAPIPQTLRFDQVLGAVITRDFSADPFSAPENRRKWTWRCIKMTKLPWVTDPSRYSFELTNCTGDGPNTIFPV
jgi:hypothetical protein